MGRSPESASQGMNCIVDRWARSSRALKKEDQQFGEKLVELARKHSGESFIGCDDPLEAVVFSVLVGMMKHQDGIKRIRGKREIIDSGVGVIPE
jgi:hypothetical protein